MWESTKAFLLSHYDLFKDFAAPVVAFIGVLVTGGLALKGLNSFERWRREKIETAAGAFTSKIQTGTCLS
jgi:hypothetical protein